MEEHSNFFDSPPPTKKLKVPLVVTPGQGSNVAYIIYIDEAEGAQGCIYTQTEPKKGYGLAFRGIPKRWWGLKSPFAQTDSCQKRGKVQIAV
jgi:hypothetical protein